MERRKRLWLRALDEFVCAGSACPETCCRHWRFDLDDSTLAKWRTAQPQTTAQWLQQSVDLSSPGRPGLQHRSDGCCVHLSAERLCAVQAALGHDWLPETCRVYPRATVSSAATALETAHLSCPEIVAILHRQWRAGEPPYTMAVAAPAGECTAADSPLAAVQRTLENYLQQVMDWRGPLGVRLYDVAGMLAFVSRKAGEGSLNADALADKAGRKPQATERRLERTAEQFASRKLIANRAVRQRFWSLVLAGGDALQKDWARSHLQASGFSAKLSARDDGKSLQGFMQQAREALAAANPEAMPFLERYLEVKFCNHGFPWHPIAGNYTATFLDCLLAYAQCLLLLQAMAMASARVDDQALERSVYMVERSVSHNTRLFDFLKRTPWLLEPERYREVLLELG